MTDVAVPLDDPAAVVLALGVVVVEVVVEVEGGDVVDVDVIADVHVVDDVRAGAVVAPRGARVGTLAGGAGIATKRLPPSVVRTICAQRPWPHGTVPSSQNSFAEICVYASGSNPRGTGPPFGATRRSVVGPEVVVDPGEVEVVVVVFGCVVVVVAFGRVVVVAAFGRVVVVAAFGRVVVVAAFGGTEVVVASGVVVVVAGAVADVEGRPLVVGAVR